MVVVDARAVRLQAVHARTDNSATTTTTEARYCSPLDRTSSCTVDNRNALHCGQLSRLHPHLRRHVCPVCPRTRSQGSGSWHSPRCSQCNAKVQSFHISTAFLAFPAKLLVHFLAQARSCMLRLHLARMDKPEMHVYSRRDVRNMCECFRLRMLHRITCAHRLSHQLCP